MSDNARDFDGRMGSSQLAPRYWICPRVSCGHRNEWRGTSRKCQGCGGMTRRKKRVPKHAEVIRDTPFPDFAALSVLIHGGNYGACAVCGKEPKDTRNMDRDHGHDRSEASYGRARGLACPGDWGCNKIMSRINLTRARQIVAYLERVEAYYSELDR